MAHEDHGQEQTGQSPAGRRDARPGEPGHQDAGHGEPGHKHDHRGHSHAHSGAAAGDRRVIVTVVLNAGLALAQLIGGLFSGSLSLIAEAVHNFSDALAFVVALVARRIGRRPADRAMTFGYARAETVAALVNYVTLIIIALWLAVEGVLRLLDPQPIAGWPVVIIATLALVVNFGTAALTYAMSKTSMNIRAAFLHNLADAFGSFGVIAAGIAALVWNVTIVDPLVTLGISAYIMWHTLREIGPVIRLLMLGSPAEPGVDAVLGAMRGVPGVADVHHLHLWQVDEGRVSVEAHVALAPGVPGPAAAVKRELKAALQRIGIAHATLELEAEPDLCRDAPLIGRA